MVYGITPQESPADMERESKRRETPIMDQTIIERKSKREQTSPIQEVLTKAIDTNHTKYPCILSDNHEA